MKTFFSRDSAPSLAVGRSEPPKIYRFEEFELSTVPSRLTRRGRLIELQPQPARALELLIAHRGEVVSREMLREHLWGKGTYLDHEQGINFALRKIRIALGDRPSAPRFVETVPRRGYRFIAPVEEGAADKKTDRAREEDPVQEDAAPRRSGFLGRRPARPAGSRPERRRNESAGRCRSSY